MRDMMLVKPSPVALSDSFDAVVVHQQRVDGLVLEFQCPKNSSLSRACRSATVTEYVADAWCKVSSAAR